MVNAYFCTGEGRLYDLSAVSAAQTADTEGHPGRCAHVDLTNTRQRRGAAVLFGCRLHAVTTYVMQHGGRLDYERLPTAWVSHAFEVLERVQAEHGVLPMARVFDLLADEHLAYIDRPLRRRRQAPGRRAE